jgi:D-arabinose 1-dehydrogenase-like Zn-dependent alcohol dehydrogenase
MAEANRAEVFTLVQEGVLRPAIAKTHPFRDFAKELNHVTSGESAGRIVNVRTTVEVLLEFRAPARRRSVTFQDR